MTQSPHTPPNWYPDPHNPAMLRWWDGTQWTNQTQFSPATTMAPTPPTSLMTPAQEKPIIKQWWFWGIIAVAVIIIAAVASQAIQNDDPSAPTTSPAAWPIPTTQTSESANPVSNSTSEAPPSEAPSTEAPVSTITNGDHLVGTSLAAGVYRADVQDGLFDLCTISQKTAAGDYYDTRLSSEGSVIFTIVDDPGSIVSFSGCDNIGLAYDRLRTGTTTVTNGYWLVGDEIATGLYQCSVDMDSAFPMAMVTQHTPDGSISDISSASEGNVLFTVQDIPGSVTDFTGCAEIVKTG